jgi:hypothetical protein
MRYPVSYKILPVLLLLTVCQGSFAQKRQESDAQKKQDSAKTLKYYPKVRFIREAPVIIPGLVREGKWELVQNFIENWKRSDLPNDEMIFSLNTLSAIENKKFSVFQLPCDYLFFLEDYARQSENLQAHPVKFRYYIRLSAGYSYDATEDARELLLFTHSWAKRLLATRALDSTESFLCQVLAGTVQHPRSFFQTNKENYPSLNIFEQNLNAYNNRYFMARRNGRIGTASIMTGLWAPTGNLRLLGTHPSVGISLGIRNNKNEYDLVWSFRFLHPTPGNYTYVRNDTLHTSNYYDGGYIGFDYTRYVIRKPHFELGWVSAIAYDYFSVASGFGTSSSDYQPGPINVGSFDFSNGIRVKYFFHRASFIGLVAKYHLIHYDNAGGTDLSGDAYTIDLVFGSH